MELRRSKRTLKFLQGEDASTPKRSKKDCGSETKKKKRNSDQLNSAPKRRCSKRLKSSAVVNYCEDSNTSRESLGEKSCKVVIRKIAQNEKNYFSSSDDDDLVPMLADNLDLFCVGDQSDNDKSQNLACSKTEVVAEKNRQSSRYEEFGLVPVERSVEAREKNSTEGFENSNKRLSSLPTPSHNGTTVKSTGLSILRVIKQEPIEDDFESSLFDVTCLNIKTEPVDEEFDTDHRSVEVENYEPARLRETLEDSELQNIDVVTKVQNSNEPMTLEDSELQNIDIVTQVQNSNEPITLVDYDQRQELSYAFLLSFAYLFLFTYAFFALYYCAFLQRKAV